MGDASLSVNGREHKGWTEVSVTRSLEQFAHTFEIGFTEHWTETGDPVPIREGDTCVLKLDGKPVTAGYVVEASIEEDGQDRTFRVSGSSVTADLVDCSALRKGGHWNHQTLKQIAQDLCAPFGIQVKTDLALGDLGGPFSTFALQDAETVYECLERACRMHGILMTTSPTGALVFTKPGARSTATKIERGVNVLKSARVGSWKDRYSKYILKAQNPGNDHDIGIPIVRQKRIADDDVVNRWRPLIIVAEQHMGTSAKLQERANWERNVRAGRAVRLRYTLDGWENAEGLWQPNTLVSVKDPVMQVDTTLLIVSVQCVKSEDEGSVTLVELADPKAMTVEPLTKQPKGNNKYLEYLRGTK